MRKRKQNSFIFRVVGVISVLLFGFVTQVNAQQSYTKYCNDRYGFCVEYPVNFGIKPAAINNDGRVFYDTQGYTMRAYGSYNALEHSIKAEMRDEEKGFDIITYRAAKNNWYVLSGYKDDNIVYLKTYMSRNKEIFYHLYMRYPAKFKTEYNKIVSKVSKSFKPGS